MGKISAKDLGTIRALIEVKRGEEAIEMVERENAYVFRFKNSKPYVVPKERKK